MRALGAPRDELKGLYEKYGLDSVLDAPIKRVWAPDTPIPFSPALEKAWIPDEERLIAAISEMM